MKRPHESKFPDLPGHIFLRNIENALSKEQLAGIGKVAILWADCDELVNLSLQRGLRLTSSIARAAISGLALPKKTSLINECAEKLLLTVSIRNLIGTTISACGNLGDYRDAVVHSTIIAHTGQHPDIGRQVSRAGKKYDVLRSQEALDGLAERLDILRDELSTIDNIFTCVTCSHTVDGDTGKISEGTGPVSERVGPLIGCLASLQARREQLKPLPKFPD
ncbi:MAG: hypothetical protein NUV55_00585 [Sulfuricaulis sp.]|uniref:hypothetical protein n=1 Tax=Sulfuricaulis sp. TaxID=2003553 RepID=UPI0025D757A5|nr:hypothetical protein [Sulfuricaulis sp.]MCR4345693.1 hypothetical protein [Sulfuricaulis sp.]